MRNLIILLFVLFTGVSQSQVAVDTALDFTVKDLTGTQHHLYGYLDAGNYVVIDFFTANCGPCQTYASEVSASYDYFGCNGGNVVFLGMNWGSDNQAVHEFDSIWGANYPSVSGLQGGGNNVVDAYQVQSYPSVILIAPDRTILNDHIWPPETGNINAEVMAAGGIPQACTVGVSDVVLQKTTGLQVVSNGNGSILLRADKSLEAGRRPQILSAGGRGCQDFLGSDAGGGYSPAGPNPGLYRPGGSWF
ncbi:MAG: TlpA family protein disulfide reductase [Bacteroidales bacterium]|nr:TlpA family protein disulfide reductase [Bacteroidales bacterium]